MSTEEQSITARERKPVRRPGPMGGSGATSHDLATNTPVTNGLPAHGAEFSFTQMATGRAGPARSSAGGQTDQESSRREMNKSVAEELAKPKLVAMKIVESQPSSRPSELLAESATDRMTPELPLTGKAGHRAGYAPGLAKGPRRQSGQGQPGSSVGARDPENGRQKATGAGLSEESSRFSMARYNARDAMRTSKLLERGQIVISSMQKSEGGHEAGPREEPARYPCGRVHPVEVGPIYQLSPRRLSQMSKAQYRCDVRSKSQHAARLRQRGRSQLVPASITGDHSNLDGPGRQEILLASQLEADDEERRLRNSFMQVVSCHGHQRSAGSMAYSYGMGIRDQAPTKGPSTAAQAFGGRYGSRMRRRYREKVRQKIEEIQELHGRLSVHANLFASMQNQVAVQLEGVEAGASATKADPVIVQQAGAKPPRRPPGQAGDAGTGKRPRAGAAASTVVKSKAAKSTTTGTDPAHADLATQTEESDGAMEHEPVEAKHLDTQNERLKQAIPIPPIVDTARSPATWEQSPMGTQYNDTHNDSQEMPRESPIYEPAGARSRLSPCVRLSQRKNSPGREEPPPNIEETPHQDSAIPQTNPSLTPIKKSSTARSSNISISKGMPLNTLKNAFLTDYSGHRAHPLKDQNIYKLPIIKILEIQSSQASAQQFFSQGGMKTQPSRQDRTQRQEDVTPGKAGLGGGGSVAEDSIFKQSERQPYRTQSSFDVPGTRSTAMKKGEHSIMSSPRSQTACAGQGRTSCKVAGRLLTTEPGGFSSERYPGQQSFQAAFERAARGQVQEFVESAIQSRASNILCPQDQSISLLKDLRKMQSALSYLQTTDRELSHEGHPQQRQDPRAATTQGGLRSSASAQRLLLKLERTQVGTRRRPLRVGDFAQRATSLHNSVMVAPQRDLVMGHFVVQAKGHEEHENTNSKSNSAPSEKHVQPGLRPKHTSKEAGGRGLSKRGGNGEGQRTARNEPCSPGQGTSRSPPLSSRALGGKRSTLHSQSQGMSVGMSTRSPREVANGATEALLGTLGGQSTARQGRSSKQAGVGGEVHLASGRGPPTHGLGHPPRRQETAPAAEQGSRGSSLKAHVTKKQIMQSPRSLAMAMQKSKNGRGPQGQVGLPASPPDSHPVPLSSLNGTFLNNSRARSPLELQAKVLGEDLALHSDILCANMREQGLLKSREAAMMASILAGSATAELSALRAGHGYDPGAGILGLDGSQIRGIFGATAMQSERQRFGESADRKREALRPQSREFYHKKRPFKHQRPSSRLRAPSQRTGGSRSCQPQRTAFSPRTASLAAQPQLHAKLQDSSELSVEYIYKIRRAHQGLLRKVLGVTRRKDEDQEYSEYPGCSARPPTHSGVQSVPRPHDSRRSEGPLSTQQEVSVLISKVNSTTQRSTALFGPGRGQQPAAQSTQRYSTTALERNSFLGASQLSQPQMRGMSRPRGPPKLNEVLGYDHSYLSRGLNKLALAESATASQMRRGSKSLLAKSRGMAAGDSLNDSHLTQQLVGVGRSVEGHSQEQEELLGQIQASGAALRALASLNQRGTALNEAGGRGTRVARVPATQHPDLVTGCRELPTDDQASNSGPGEAHAAPRIHATDSPAPDSMKLRSSQPHHLEQMTPLYHDKTDYRSVSMNEDAQTRGRPLAGPTVTQKAGASRAQAPRASAGHPKTADPGDLGRNEKEKEDTRRAQALGARPTPEHIRLVKVQADATLQADQALRESTEERKSAKDPATQGVAPARTPKPQAEGATRSGRAALGADAGPGAGDTAKRNAQGEAELNEGGRHPGEQGSTNADCARASATNTHREGAISNDTMIEDTVPRTTSSDRFAYAVEIETNKKTEAGQAAEHRHQDPAIHRRGAESASLMEKQSQIDKESQMSQQSVGGLHARPAKLYQRAPPMKRGAQAGSTSRGEAAIQSEQHCPSASSPRDATLGQTWRAPGTAIHTTESSLSKPKKSQVAPRLHKLQYILKTFDKQKHEYHMQLQSYQHVQLQGRQQAIFRHGPLRAAGNDYGPAQLRRASKGQNTQSCSDSHGVYDMTSPRRSLSPLESPRAQHLALMPRGVQQSQSPAVQSFEVFPPSAHLVLSNPVGEPVLQQHSDMTELRQQRPGQTDRSGRQEGAKKHVVYQQSLGQARPGADLTCERPREDSAPVSPVSGGQEARSLSPAGLTKYKLAVALSGPDSGEEEVVVRDQSQQFSNTQLAGDVGPGTQASASPGLPPSTTTKEDKPELKTGQEAVGEDDDKTEKANPSPWEAPSSLPVIAQNSKAFVVQGADASATRAAAPDGDEEPWQRRQSEPAPVAHTSRLPAAPEEPIGASLKLSSAGAPSLPFGSTIKPAVTSPPHEHPASDGDPALSPPPVLRHRLEHPVDGKVQAIGSIMHGSPRTGYDHVRRVYIRSLGATARTPGASPDANPDCSNDQGAMTESQARKPPAPGTEAKWLFPENLLTAEDQQHELLQVVRRYQRYRKRAQGQH